MSAMYWGCLGFVSIAIALVVTFGCTRALVYLRQQASAQWSQLYLACKNAEFSGISEDYLTLNGVTDNELRCHEVDRESLRQYLLWLNSVWADTSVPGNLKGQRRDRNEGVWPHERWSDATQIGRVLRSEKFVRAWPILQIFWTTSTTSNLAMSIDDIVQSTLASCDDDWKTE